MTPAGRSVWKKDLQRLDKIPVKIPEIIPAYSCFLASKINGKVIANNDQPFPNSDKLVQRISGKIFAK